MQTKKEKDNEGTDCVTARSGRLRVKQRLVKEKS